VRYISNASIPVVGPRDRRCRGWTLDNRARRWLAPAGAEVDRLSVQPGHHIADLGAGVGYLTAALLERIGPSGTLAAVDPDARNLLAAQQTWGADPRVDFIAESAADVRSIGNGSIDRVVLSLVLCCMVDKVGALDDAWRILRPGGLVLVSYPEAPWGWSFRKSLLRVSPTLWSQLVVRHPWRVTLSERRRLIRRHILLKPPEGA
jgi:S-adenosylmethionine-diacylgycerolhomoserine-N-methlytransferase